MASVERATPSGITYSNNAYPVAVKARTKTMKVYPSNGNSGFGPNNPMIRIPLNIDGFLDTRHSFLQFECQVTFPSDSRGPKCPNKDVVLEGGASSLIERLVVRGSDNSTIEDIQHYNLLANCLYKTQTGPNFSQTVMQALAGMAGKATNPIPAVTDGGDYAKPFNPSGRHAIVKALTTTPSAAAPFLATEGLNWPSLGPLWEFSCGAETGSSTVAASATIYPIIKTADHNEQVSCSIEAAGPEQFLAWQAGLGTRTVENGAVSNIYQAWYLGEQNDHVDLLNSRSATASLKTPLETVDTERSIGYDDTSAATLAVGLLSFSASTMTMAALNSKVKPDRCFNRQGAGIGSTQISTSRYAQGSDALTSYLTREASPGASGYNSRANPLSAPSFCGTNHRRCVAGMGATVTAAGQNFPTGYDANAQLYGQLGQANNVAANKVTQKNIQARVVPAHDFMEPASTAGHYDSTAELAYNDWFAFQHTTCRAVGQTLMTSDGSCTPAPLISYVGSDGVTTSNTDMVIRWDKAKTKGCQNLKGRMVLGHARSSHLFDTAVESLDTTVTAASVDSQHQAVAQTINQTFMIPLISGLLCNDMYLPLQFISGGGLVLEVHFATNAYVPFKIIPDQPTPLEEPMSAGFNGMSYVINNPVYHAQVVNFDSEMNERYAQLVQSGGVAWNGQTFRAHQSEFLTSNASEKLTISERVQCLKSLFTLFRPQCYFSGGYKILQVNSLSSYRCGVTGYQWTLGSNKIPQTKVPIRPMDYDSKYPGYPFPRTDLHNGETSGGFNAVDFGDHYDNASESLAVNTAEAYMETLKAFNLMSNMNLNTSLLIEDFERECKIATKQGTDPITATAITNWGFETLPSPWDCEFQGGMFVLGLNTETFIQDSGRIQSGYNTAATAMNISLDLDRKANNVGAACSAIHFAWVDQAYTITPDGMLVANV